MDIEIKKLEKILKQIPKITKENQKYWLGEAGEYHRFYLLQWYKDCMELVAEIRKEMKDVK